jgi:hypothetical protein
MIATNTYEFSDARATMRNLVRESCMDSEQRVEKPGRNCSRRRDKALLLRMLFAAASEQAGALIRLPNFYSTSRRFETFAIATRGTIASQASQLFFRFPRTPPSAPAANHYA